jgi:hypothetical protein
MAAKQAGALSTVKSLKVPSVGGLATDADDAVDTAMQRVMDAYTARQQRNYDPGLMAIAQGLLSSKGNFGEAAGMAAKNYQDVQGQLRQEDIDTAQAELQLEQSRRDQMLVRRKMEQSKELFGGATPGVFQGLANGVVDQDALGAFTDMGMPEADARMMLAVQSAPATPTSSVGMDMNRLQKYIFTNGYDDNAKAAVEMLKLQNDRYALQNGMRIEKATGKVDYAQPVGLPAQGEKNIELRMGDGTYKVDQRTAMLYEFANNQGPEVAQAFAKSYKEKGTVPADIVKMYNSQKPAGPSGVDGEPLTEPQLKMALSGIMLKHNASLEGSIDGTLPLTNKGAAKAVTYTPLEKKVITSFGRLLSVPPDKWTLRDKQVFEATKKEPVPLEQGAAPAAEKAPAPAVKPADQPAKAAAVVAAPAAVVPVAKAEAPAAAATSSSAPAAGRPALPIFEDVPALPAGASQEAKATWEASKGSIETRNRLKQKQYELETEQYYKNVNRPADVDAAVDKTAREERAKKAMAMELAVPEKLNSARETKYTALRIMDKVANNPNMFGIMQHPGIIPAIFNFVDKGFRLGNTTLEFAGLKDAVMLASPGVTGEALTQRTAAVKDLAELQLQFARKFLKGEGSVSNAERELVSAVTGSPNDRPDALIHRMALLVERSDYDQKEAETFNRWRDNEKNKGKDYLDFQRSPEIKKLQSSYDTKMNSLYAKWFMSSKSDGKAEAAEVPNAAVVPRYTNAQKAIADALK